VAHCWWHTMPDDASTSSSSTPTRGLGVEALQLDGVDSAAAEPITAVDAARDLRVARRMFYGGFALLPWLWFVVWIHFRKVARHPQSDPRLAAYAQRSLVGAVCGAVLFIAWVVYVQLSWQSWSLALQNSLMLIIPEQDEL